ncbi:RNA polymerase sigma factor [Gloeobacter kilaueensis]|uniref:RNA polymerase sigma factor n=1 Tax=Gloeobacter kilaueensis (strain ATCC BAA-2537 / CCAP 1431/1 / ULC 316 / JS1) TaxID=1183438 RepID=U5QDA5_GLOK1|nr:sigma-70 family RNA polymerase sigma factor [Gloeobacter kilaueensis]AGY56808.1 RNA polymerase sigma factor [Gloeobacter kilaueensis JS1]
MAGSLAPHREQSLDSLALALQSAQHRLAVWEAEHSSHRLPGWSSQTKERTTLLAARSAALQTLYTQINPPLEHFLRVRRWQFSRSGSVEDLRNQIWLALLDRIGGFDPERGTFSAWFYSYVVLLVLGRAKRENARQGTRLRPLADSELSDACGCERLDFPAECAKILHTTLAALPVRWRAIVLGLYYCEVPKKQKELAAELGITPAAVNQTKAKALAQLRSALSAADCEP